MISDEICSREIFMRCCANCVLCRIDRTDYYKESASAYCLALEKYIIKTNTGNDAIMENNYLILLRGVLCQNKNTAFILRPVAFLGGHAGNGSPCGVLCANWTNGSSNSHWDNSAGALQGCLLKCRMLATPLGENDNPRPYAG